MLRITLNGIDLDLPEDIKVDMKVVNPLFTESGFDEVYSYSFQVQKTARNKSTISKLKSKYATMQIIFANIQMESGVGVVKTYQNHFSIDFKNDSIDLRQNLEKVSLKSLPLESITVYDDADPVATKLTKWKEHMTQVTLTDAPNVGSHKFPPIRAWDTAASSSTLAEMFAKNPDWAVAYIANNYSSGEFVKNVGFPVAYNGSQPAWWATVSPCVRIQYLFDQLIAFLNINKQYDELANVEEFQQMIHYSLLAMDKVETSGGNNYNVHGSTINLTKFTPALMGIDLTRMLDELFGVFYSYRNGKLSIFLKKNIFLKPAVDLSKYCHKDYEIEHTEGVVYSLKYPIDLDAIDRFNTPVWDYQVYLDGDYVYMSKHEVRSIGTGDGTEEIELSYIPMMTRQNFLDRIYPATYSGTITDEYSVSTWFHIPFDQRSSYYDEKAYNEGGSDQWLLGCIRGKYSFYNYDTLSWEDKLVVENSRKLDPMDFSETDYTFGSCSIFINDASSHVDLYLKRWFDALKRAKIVSKTLYLPLHKILDIMSWKEPNHIIKQRNLSFKGTVKEVNFTLYKNSISPTEITYAVVEPEALGDYNDDFNTDFSG